MTKNHMEHKILAQKETFMHYEDAILLTIIGLTCANNVILAQKINNFSQATLFLKIILKISLTFLHIF
jgi:hypothetical protein